MKQQETLYITLGSDVRVILNVTLDTPAALIFKPDFLEIFQFVYIIFK